MSLNLVFVFMVLIPGEQIVNTSRERRGREGKGCRMCIQRSLFKQMNKKKGWGKRVRTGRNKTRRKGGGGS